MNKSIKKTAFVVLAFAAVLFMSSCNRGGYGCPYELKAPTSLFSLVK